MNMNRVIETEKTFEIEFTGRLVGGEHYARITDPTNQHKEDSPEYLAGELAKMAGCKLNEEARGRLIVFKKPYQP